jgi:hypothetical protein
VDEGVEFEGVEKARRTRWRAKAQALGGHGGVGEQHRAAFKKRSRFLGGHPIRTRPIADRAPPARQDHQGRGQIKAEGGGVHGIRA